MKLLKSEKSWSTLLGGDPLLLQYAKDQTEEMCLIAVTKNGLALKWVLRQTKENCYAAVKQNGLALEFCLIQEEELCIEALLQNKSSAKYIKDCTPKIVRTLVDIGGSLADLTLGSEELFSLVKEGFLDVDEVPLKLQTGRMLSLGQTIVSSENLII